MAALHPPRAHGRGASVFFGAGVFARRAGPRALVKWSVFRHAVFMKKNFGKPSLRVVEPEGEQRPSRALGEHGLALWRRVVSEYVIDDCAGSRC